MFDKDAITTLQDGAAIQQASAALAVSANTGDLVALPEHFALHDLEKYLPNRRRQRGVMETNSVDAFAEYVNKNVRDGAAVFVSHKAMVANAVLNMGTPEAPGHGDDRAQIRLDMTAAYAAMCNLANGQPLTQTQVAEFMEDWPMHITCFKDEDEVPLKHGIAAVRNITIDGMRKVEATEQQLGASKSTFEAVSASSNYPLPTHIYFNCVPSLGFMERTFVLRLGVRTTDKPAITLRIANKELHNEQIAEELVGKVRDAIGNNCPVLVGDYTAK